MFNFASQTQANILGRIQGYACATLLSLGLYVTPALTPAHAQISFPPPPCPANTSCPGTPNTPPGGTGGSCPIPPGGQTCDAPAPATQPIGQGINIGAGNPINVLSGNKYQRETDMAALPGVLGLEIVRHYNSAFSRVGNSIGIVGRGWKLSYETELFIIKNTLQIIQADGSRIIFSRDPKNPSLCASDNPAHGTIEVTRTGRGEQYTWHWANGRQLSFNSQGKLLQIAAPTGEFVSMIYNSKNMLVSVTDPQGRTLQLHYLDKKSAQAGDHFRGVQAITSPVGRFTYAYGSPKPQGSTLAPAHLLANLVAVTMPGNSDSHNAGTNAGTSAGSLTRRYHYEDARYPTLLTGITAEGTGSAGQAMKQRVATYGYDDDGKAILTVKGEPARYQTNSKGQPVLVPGTGIEQISVDNRKGGQTIITNSLGQKTVYRYGIIGGENRLLEVRGAGCASCGPANVRYQYDGLGRLLETTQLNDQGAPVRGETSELDTLGRIVQVSRINYQNGKPGQPQWSMRYEYASNQAQPTLIARHSVVAGKEMRINISYNNKGQVTSLMESGWSPSLGKEDQVTALIRTTTYQYTVINGRSLLTTVDGPLANGKTNRPFDSDITQIKYDEKGNYQIETITPGNSIFRTLNINAAGYSQIFEASDGVNPPQKIQSIRNNRGQIISITRLNNVVVDQSISNNWLNSIINWFQFSKRLAPTQASGLTTRIGYDFYERPNRITRPDGTWIEAEYDAANRMIGWHDQEGNAIRRELSSENQLLASLTYSPSTISPLDAKTQYQYDNQNRISQVIAATGAINQYAYDPNTAYLTSIADPLKRLTAFEYDQLGRLAGVLKNVTDQQNGTTKLHYQNHTEEAIAANGAVNSNTIDDFGRVLAIFSPDSGKQLARYDAADRLILRKDANGNQTSFTYNVAGQLTLRTTIGKEKQNPKEEENTENVSYRYAGTRLIAISNANQTTEYAYNADGRVIEKSDQITPVKATINSYASNPGKQQVLRFTTRYSYDALTRIQTESLASGETIQMHYDNTSRLERIELISADGKTHRALASDIQIHPLTGLTAFTHGNGLNTAYLREKSTGRLTGLTVTSRNGSAIVDTSFNLPPIIPSAHAEDSHATEKQTLYAQDMAYDIVGRITTITQSGSSQGKAQVARYDYDNFDHLNKVDSPTEKVQWRYDAVGNRMASTQQQTLTYTSGSNRLKAMNNATAKIAYEYDAMGNPTTIGQKQYGYGVTGRLQQVSAANNVLVHYTYNAEGERISKTVNLGSGKLTTTYFLYHGHQVDAEIDASGNVTVQYIYFGHTPIAKLEYPPQQINGRNSNEQKNRTFSAIVKAWFGLAQDQRGAQIYAIHSDHLGTPQLATDSSQRIVWQAHYTAFGKATVTTDTITLNLRFPGQYFDAEAGTHYNYFRDYDPGTGRYLTSDPIGLAGGVNSYAYGLAMPTEHIDPFGLKSYQIGGGDPIVIPDAGAGTWNSIPATLLKKAEKSIILNGMGAFGWPNAKAHLAHYFDNTGSDYTVDLKGMLENVVSAKGLFTDELFEAMTFAESLKLEKAGNVCSSISSSKVANGYNQKSDNKDWYYAVGGYSAWGKGKVSADILGNYTMKYEYKFFDRYNWDGGKSVDIGPIKVTDNVIGEFHLMGIAREFNMVGSAKKTVTWKKGGSPIIKDGW